ncbi:MAG: hypothetical protein ACFB11_00885 [Paracoccaceae bacterium]
MIDYVIIGDQDVVIEAGRSASLPAGAVAVSFTGKPSEALDKMLSEGVLVDRPATLSVTVNGNEVTVVDCPAGTEIVVDPEWGLAQTFTISTGGTTETFQLIDAGFYEVHVRPPLPTLPSSVEVQV